MSRSIYLSTDLNTPSRYADRSPRVCFQLVPRSFFRKGLRLPHAAIAGVVDNHVKAVEALDNGSKGDIHTCLRADVKCQLKNLWPIGPVAQGLDVARGCHYFVASIVDVSGIGFAQASGTPSD